MSAGRLWVKICANTTAADALLAAHCGADAVGFVFAPSRRQVTAAEVARITPLLPAHVERVGVFAGWSAHAIVQAVEQASLTAAQLHDGWNAALADELAAALGEAFPLLWVVPWRLDGGVHARPQVAEALGQITHNAPGQRALLDAKVGHASGGLGLSFDWMAAGGEIAACAPLHVVVAGGLSPENLATALERTRPYGVDVASGVEERPGVKNPERLREFLRIARAMRQA